MCPPSERPSESTDPSSDDSPTQENYVADDQPTQAIPKIEPEPEAQTTRIPRQEREGHDPAPMTQRIPEVYGDDDAYGNRRDDTSSAPRFATPADPHETPEERQERRAREDAEHQQGTHWDAKAAYGGMNIGAALYGWLCAFGLVLLVALASVTLMLVFGLGSDASVSSFGRMVGDSALGIGVGGAVLAVIATFAGGYVAGRMSRFDGGRQGIGVWVFVLLSAAAVVIAAIVMADNVNVPSSMDWMNTLGSPGEWGLTVWGGVAAGAAATLAAGVFGAMVGHRYHVKVDRLLDPRR